MSALSKSLLTKSGSAGRPLVTIITATYNAASTLLSCLESVRSQDYPNLQHLVIDGSSTDGTRDLLRVHAHEAVTWLSERDAGVYDAWNKGLRMAEGEWIAFLGADDIYLPGAVSAYMSMAAALPEVNYLSSQVRWLGPNGKPRTIGSVWTPARFARFMCTAHVGSMHRRSLFEQFGAFDKTYRIVGDYEFLLRCAPDLRAAYLPAETAVMRCGGLSDSVAAIAEARRAKFTSGGRSSRNVWLEYWQARAAYSARRIRRQIEELSNGKGRKTCPA